MRSRPTRIWHWMAVVAVAAMIATIARVRGSPRAFAIFGTPAILVVGIRAIRGFHAIDRRIAARAGPGLGSRARAGAARLACALAAVLLALAMITLAMICNRVALD